MNIGRESLRGPEAAERLLWASASRLTSKVCKKKKFTGRLCLSITSEHPCKIQSSFLLSCNKSFLKIYCMPCTSGDSGWWGRSSCPRQRYSSLCGKSLQAEGAASAQASKGLSSSFYYYFNRWDTVILHIYRITSHLLYIYNNVSSIIYMCVCVCVCIYIHWIYTMNIYIHLGP